MGAVCPILRWKKSEVYNYKIGTIPQCLAPVLTSPVRAPTAEKLKETLLVPSSVSGIQCSAHFT